MTTLERLCAFYEMPVPAPGPCPVEIKGQTRESLPRLFAHLGFTTGAEIGVWQGRFSESLCRANPDLHLTCVDSWMPYAGYRDHVRQDLMQDAYEQARARLATYATTFLTAFSYDAAKRVRDGSLDFVYIDANHGFEAVVADLAAWAPKVRPGGIISGHDYFHAPRSHGIRVVEAVNGYTAAHDIAPWFVLGRKKVKPGEVTERERSYLWVQA